MGMGIFISEREVSCDDDAGASGFADALAGWFCCAGAGVGENANKNTNKNADSVQLTNV